MLQKIQNTLRKNDEGASAVEYGLLVAAIAAVIVVVVFVLGTYIQGAFSDTCDEIGASNGEGDCATE